MLQHLVEFIVVLGSAQVGQESEHAQDAFGVVLYLVLGGLEVEFGGVGEASADVA